MGYGSKTDCYSAIDPNIPSPHDYDTATSTFPTDKRELRCNFGAKHTKGKVIDPVI